MGIEIERKFLVENTGWMASAGEGRNCVQGYLASGDGTTVRVRMIGDEAFLTIKGPTSGIRRTEFEYPIPVADAEAMLALCENWVEKIRYIVKHAGNDWEVDVFCGVNEGLVLAEIELGSETQSFESPPWLGREVSGDPRYYNAYLAAHPFNRRD